MQLRLHTSAINAHIPDENDHVSEKKLAQMTVCDPQNLACLSHVCDKCKEDNGWQMCVDKLEGCLSHVDDDEDIEFCLIGSFDDDHDVYEPQSCLKADYIQVNKHCKLIYSNLY